MANTSIQDAALKVVDELGVLELDAYERHGFDLVTSESPVVAALELLRRAYPPHYHLPLDGEKLWIGFFRATSAGTDDGFYTALERLVELQAWLVTHYDIAQAPTELTKLTDTEDMVLRRVTSEPLLGKEIASLLGFKEAATRRHLAALVRKGMVKKHQNGGYYRP